MVETDAEEAAVEDSSSGLPFPGLWRRSLNLDGPFDIPDPNPGVGIGEVRPTEGAPGDVVQIFGVNLGFPGTRVEIGGISAPIQSRSMTQIVVVVPNVAPDLWSLAVLVDESESFPGGFSIFEGFTVLED